MKMKNSTKTEEANIKNKYRMNKYIDRGIMDIEIDEEVDMNMVEEGITDKDMVVEVKADHGIIEDKIIDEVEVDI